MNAFIAVLQNNMRRALVHKGRMIVTFVLITGAILGAIFFNTRAEVAGHIALVTQNADVYPGNPALRVTTVQNAPPLSELVSGAFDAVVTDLGNGTYEIMSIKGAELEEALALLLEHPGDESAPDDGDRKIGASIFGFLLMFILMQGMTWMYLFAEDKEKRLMGRVAASPVPFTGYLCAHGLFSFAFMLIPAVTILYAVKWILNVDIGLGFLQYVLLLSLLCAFSTALALFLNAFIRKSDSANMAGSATVVLTSVLSGSFYSFEKGNAVLETAIKVLPQKALLTLANGMESDASFRALAPHAAYVLILTIALLVLAVSKTKRENVMSR